MPEGLELPGAQPPPMGAPAGGPMAPPQPGAMPGAPPMPAAGPTGPAAVGSQSAGLRARGMVKISMAMAQIKQALPFLDTGSPEEKAALVALTNLTKHFGQASESLTKAEVQTMGAQAPGIQTPTPQQGQAFGQMIKSLNAGRGIGGAPGTPAPSTAPAPAGMPA